MHQQCQAARQRENQELPTASDVFYAAPCYLLAEFLQGGPVHAPLPAHTYTDNGAPHEQRAQVALDGLDLRKLRHPNP